MFRWREQRTQFHEEVPRSPIKWIKSKHPYQFVFESWIRSSSETQGQIVGRRETELGRAENDGGGGGGGEKGEDISLIGLWQTLPWIDLVGLRKSQAQ